MASATPDRAALEFANYSMRTGLPLDQVMAHPTLRIILENRARQYMQRRARIDVKKLQANDHD